MRRDTGLACLLLGITSFTLASTAAPSTATPKPGPTIFQKQIQPLLVRYCYDCHGNGKKKGDLALDLYPTPEAIRADLKSWETILQYVRDGEMPPQNKPQPTAEERQRIVRWIDNELFPCDCDHPDPGRVTIRRLNRTEYNNTIHDLLGIDFNPAEDFPADDVGYGFDNIGDVLSLPPLLFEKYLTAAEKAVDLALAKPEARQRLLGVVPANEESREAARRVLAPFTQRAWRRPVAPADIDRLLGLFDLGRKGGEDFEQSVKLALQAVLVSPHFLFRGELQPSPDDPAVTRPVDDYALASRLSYFLWSTMPDEELFVQADRKTLRRNLEAQVRRMLKDPRSEALVQNFADQWLQTRKLLESAPDAKLFPAFSEPLRQAMLQETRLYFGAILRGDRSVLEFIDSDYTFLNEPLAKLYGIGGVTGNEFRRVSVKGTPRGGVLTHASVLTSTSNPTRTSPVKRGKWVLDNILGAPPPPPPPAVPELSEATEAVESASLRQRMEQHRADPACANCHARMDPLGFGFENFDAIGAWRDREGRFPVDPAGQLVSGETFDGPAGLKAILLKKKRDDFVRCVSEKMLTYALGRGLEHYDRCAVDEISQGLAKRRYRFSDLVLGVVKSTPFQMRRGEGSRSAVASK